MLLPSGNLMLAAGSFNPGLGSYTLSSAVTPADIGHCEEVFVVRGISTTQNVQSTDCVASGPHYGDLLTIYLEANTSFTVSMSSTAFDAYLELYDGAGSLVGSNDDVRPGTLDAEITYTPPDAGYHFILATTAFTSATGSYTLTVPFASAALASVTASPVAVGAQSPLRQVMSAAALSTLSAQGTMVKRSHMLGVNLSRRAAITGKVAKPSTGTTGPVTVREEKR